MNHVDLGAARSLVSDWLDEHHGGTLEQMTADLKGRFPDHEEDMAVVMRGHDGGRAPPPDIPFPAGPAAAPAMSARRTGGTQEWLKVIDGGAGPRQDSVTRLHQFQGDHPDVQFTSPTTGPRAQNQYTALIPAGTIPCDDHEIITRSADLRGLMDQLDDLFPPATG